MKIDKKPKSLTTATEMAFRHINARAEKSLKISPVRFERFLKKIDEYLSRQPQA